MIPGLNSNVRHAGVDYHVQTEDLGGQNPFVLTLVFRDGAILAREKVNYHETLGEGATEAQIKRFMGGQHHRIIQTLLAGQSLEVAPSGALEGPPAESVSLPTGPDLPLTDEAIDQLIVEYLRTRRAANPR